MRRAWVVAVPMLAFAMGGGPALAADDATRRAPAVPPADASLILSIRARALGIVSEFPDGAAVERMRAPTGEGTSRMPSATTEIARGVYLTVTPACIPGLDEPVLLPPYRRPIDRRR